MTMFAIYADSSIIEVQHAHFIYNEWKFVVATANHENLISIYANQDEVLAVVNMSEGDALKLCAQLVEAKQATD